MHVCDAKMPTPLNLEFVGTRLISSNGRKDKFFSGKAKV